MCDRRSNNAHQKNKGNSDLGDRLFHKTTDLINRVKNQVSRIDYEIFIIIIKIL